MLVSLCEAENDGCGFGEGNEGAGFEEGCAVGESRCENKIEEVEVRYVNP